MNSRRGRPVGSSAAMTMVRGVRRPQLPIAPLRAVASADGGRAGGAVVAASSRAPDSVPAIPAAPSTVHGPPRIAWLGRDCADQPAAVTVAGDDQQLGALAGLHHLALCPPVTFQPGGRTAKAARGSIQKLLSRSLGQSFDPGARITLRMTTTEQPAERTARRRRNLVPRHAQQPMSVLPGTSCRAASMQDIQVPSVIQMSTATTDQPPIGHNISHGARTAATSAAGTVISPSLVNSPSAGSESCSRNTLRHNKGGERTDVGQAGSDVHADQRRRHWTSSAECCDGQQHQNRRQVVDQVGEHSGATRHPEQRRQRPTVG